MRTKTLCILLCACMLVGTFAACTSGPAASAAPSAAPSATPSAASSAAPSASASASPAASGNPASIGAIGKDPVSLSFAWQTAGQANEAVNADTVKSIMTDYPNVTIKVENAATGEYQTLIALDVAAGNCPDWFSYWRPEPSYGFDKYIAAGAIADLGELLDDPYFKDQFLDFAVNTGTVNKVFYGVPGSYSFIVMIANKDIYDQCGLSLPNTWDDWINDNKVIKDKGFYPFCVSTKPYSFGAERLLEYCLTRFCVKPEDKNLGVSYINNRVLEMLAGNEPFNTPEAVNACKAFIQFTANNVAEDAVTLDDAQSCAKYFNTGKAAVYVNGQYGLPSVDKSMYGKLVALKFPEIPGAQENGPINDADLTQLFYASAKGWADPAKKPVIYEMMKRMCSDDTHYKLTNECAYIAPTKKNYIDDKVAIPIMIQAKDIADASQQVKWLFGRAKPENKEVFYSIFTDAWYGKYTGEQFAQKLQDTFYQK